jgi:hypothetical protein
VENRKSAEPVTAGLPRRNDHAAVPPLRCPSLRVKGKKSGCFGWEDKQKGTSREETT